MLHRLPSSLTRLVQCQKVKLASWNFPLYELLRCMFVSFRARSVTYVDVNKVRAVDVRGESCEGHGKEGKSLTPGLASWGPPLALGRMHGERYTGCLAWAREFRIPKTTKTRDSPGRGKKIHCRLRLLKGPCPGIANLIPVLLYCRSELHSGTFPVGMSHTDVGISHITISLILI